jgi:hypothetical protein
MVPRWKRVLLSLASVAILPAIAYCAAYLRASIRGYGDIMLGVGLTLYIVFSLLGWILSLPFVLFVTDLRGWRLSLWLGIGILLGPALVEGVILLPNSGLSPLSLWSGSVSAIASGAAAAIYLFVFRWMQRRVARRPSTSPIP